MTTGTKAARMLEALKDAIASRSIPQLVELYQESDRQLDAKPDADTRDALVRVRGLIMDELDARGEAGDEALKVICGVTDW
jgi:hypothetical protein